MAITQVITTLPDAPDPATMTRDQFSTAAAASVLAQKAMVPELNTWAGQVNAIAAVAVGDVATAIGSAAAATPVGADKICWRQNSSGLLKSATFSDVLAGGTLPGAFTTLSASGVLTFGAGSFIADGLAKVYTTAANGMIVVTKAGSSTDLIITNASGNDVLSIPAGTNNLALAGGLAVTGTISATTTIKTGGYTVATLPAGVTGDRAYVTDATAPTYLSALTGGGAVVCPVFKNATTWVSA